MSAVLQGVDYRYAGSSSPAIRGVDLELHPGTVTGLVGPNDAGKTTLCLVVAGLAPATIGGTLQGTVTLDDLDTRTARPWELAERCGSLSQEPSTQLSGTSETVWEEVAFGPRNLGLPLDEVIDRVEDALELLGIRELAERDPARLSGGQGQLVVLAGVLALRPRYLVLDEPTSQLDPAGTRMVGAVLRRIARETGSGILVAEHKTDLLAMTADRVVVLADGAIVGAGDAAAILGDAALPDRGVTPPAEVRLRRALLATGLSEDLADQALVSTRP